MKDLPDDATGQALLRLVEHGSDLLRPMEMDFHLAFPSEAAGRLVASGAQQMGFETAVEKDDCSGDWTCYCTKTIIPSYEVVVHVEDLLDALARTHGGYADGFGSFGNAPDAD